MRSYMLEHAVTKYLTEVLCNKPCKLVSNTVLLWSLDTNYRIKAVVPGPEVKKKNMRFGCRIMGKMHISGYGDNYKDH